MTPSQTGTQSNIREGSTIFIRIIEQTGSNTYTAGFSGGRFSVKSNIPLEIGSSHLVKVSVNDGHIEMAVQKPSTHGAEIYNLSGGALPEASMTAELSAYFTALGLAPDATTLRLFQQMKTLGMKYDAAVLRKAWRVAQDFPGHEKEAGEAALILEQKGISANADSVNALLMCLPFSEKTDGGASDGKNDEKPEAGDSASTEDRLSPDYIKKFFLSVLDGSYFDAQNETKECGVISLFNSISGGNEGDWVCVPFDFSAGESGDGSGKLRIFLKKTAKKIAINIFFGGKKFNFVLYFNQDKCSKIDFGLPDDVSLDERLRLQKQLEAETGIRSEVAPYDALLGFCPDNLPVNVVRGSA